jgi:glycosyltransferase involved in cell wall biosynthesis
LHLVGADAPESVLALADRPGVNFHGHVPDLEALLDRTRISLAPLRFGAGIKGKVNQALARGLPVVATSCAIEGMFLIDGEDVLCADTAEQFADAIVRLYRDPALWQILRQAGFENTRRHFSRDAARRVLRPWLRGLPKVGTNSV